MQCNFKYENPVIEYSNIYIGLFYYYISENYQYIRDAIRMISFTNHINLNGEKFVIKPMIMVIETDEECQIQCRQLFLKWKELSNFVGLIGGIKYKYKVIPSSVTIKTVDAILQELNIMLFVTHPTAGEYCHPNVVKVFL